MGRKASAQVDFAIASGMFIIIFAFLVLFSTDYFSSLKNDATLTEKRGFALSLLNDLLDQGEPASWQFSMQTFSNNSAANWSISLNRTTNSTIRTFSAGELNQAGDSKYAYINNSELADVLEFTFPYLGIPQNAAMGNSSFKVLYNTSSFEQSGGDGDYKDDLTAFSEGFETYMDDWGNGSTSSLWIWWNSTDYLLWLYQTKDANNLVARLYFSPSSPGICYFDQINFTANYSYYPYYPKKLGISADIYIMEILLNNTVQELAAENVTVNFTLLGYPDADMNSIFVQNETGSPISCNVSGKILTFQTQISNGVTKWFRVWFSKNSTSNFSSAACSATVSSGTNSLTTANRNETLFSVQRSSAIHYSKLSALNSSNYMIMKNLTDVKYDFHVTLKNSTGSPIFEYGGEIPSRADINALQRSVIYQNSSAGINYGTLYLYMW